MNCDKKAMLLYAITDRAWVGEKSLYEQVEDALEGGATCIQLREKHLDYESFLEEAKEMAKLCHKYNVPLIINDNAQIAAEADADGVHVGQKDMKAADVRKIIGDKRILGVSARTVEQAKEAEENGADYLGVGAVFTTLTKSDAKPVEHSVVKQICETVDIPVVAIGGINDENILELKGTGVDGVALVSAVFASKDIKSECKKLRKLSEEMVRK